jgi:hypothetical protein
MKTPGDLIRKAGPREGDLRLLDKEGMTTIRMPNLRKSVQSAGNRLRDLWISCGEE